MAIVTEQHVIDGRDFTRTYSDAGRGVVRDGVQYSEAWDPTEFGRTYTEGELLPDADAQAEQLLNIILGEEETP